MLILTPGFSLVGIKFSVGRIRARHGTGAAVVFGAAVFMMFLVSAPLCLILVSFAGVVATMMKHFNINRNAAQ